MMCVVIHATTSGNTRKVAEAIAESDEAFARTFDLTRSWLVSVGLDTGVVRSVATLLVIGVVAGFILAALSTAGLLVPTAWWGGLVIGSAAASVILLGIAFSPTLLLGFAINAVLLWVAIASVWTPVAADAHFGLA